MTETNTIQPILNAIFMIVWPLLYVAIAVAGILLFRAEKRHFNLCITIGGTVAFLSSIAHLMFFLPVVGLMSSGKIDQATIPKFFLFTSAVSAIALALIAYGILTHAWVFLKTRQNATLAADHHR